MRKDWVAIPQNFKLGLCGFNLGIRDVLFPGPKRVPELPGRVVLESPSDPNKNGVIAQNKGVINPLLKGHADSRVFQLAKNNENTGTLVPSDTDPQRPGHTLPLGSPCFAFCGLA